MWIIFLSLLVLFLHFYYKKQVEYFNTGPFPDKLYPNLALRNTTCLINYNLEANPYMIWDNTFKPEIMRNDDKSYQDEIADAYSSIKKQDDYLESVKSTNFNSKNDFTNQFKYCKINFENKNNCFLLYNDSDCYKGRIQKGTFGCDIY
jgi:hypothetical protein